MFGLTSGGLLVSTPAGSIQLVPGGQNDLVQIEPGYFAAITDSSSITSSPSLFALTGDTLNAANYTVSVPVPGAAFFGTVFSGAQTYEHQLVNLGDGRMMLVFSAYGGPGSSIQTGFYASVYNVDGGTPESNPTLLFAVSNQGDLVNLRLSSELTADGRVVVALSGYNGLSGFDIFHTVIDAREAGVTVVGSSAADTFVGTTFDDTFTSINFNDRIIGGLGVDSVTLAGSNARTVDLSNPDAFPGLGPVLEGIENLTGTASTDTFYGSAAANRLDGGNGNDLLVGRAGDDVLLGGVGDDTQDGGAGNDRLDGGNNNDRILGRDGNDSVYGGTGDDQVLAGAGDDLVQGGDGNDVLNGGTGNDTILGGIGNDTIVTGAGDDLVQAGDGDDLIQIDGLGAHLVLGELGSDTVSYARLPVGSQGALIVADLSGLTDPLTALFGFDEATSSFAGVENVIGSGAGDFLGGDGLANRLSGGAGNDVLVGRAGADTLTGGTGNDTFVFNAPADGADVVRDFATGADVIALALGAFGDISAENIATRFSANATATVLANASAQLLFDNSGGGAGRLFYDADGNGAGVAVLVATLGFDSPAGLGLFSAADFIFV